jgi:hypothetical protein
VWLPAAQPCPVGGGAVGSGAARAPSPRAAAAVARSRTVIVGLAASPWDRSWSRASSQAATTPSGPVRRRRRARRTAFAAGTPTSHSSGRPTATTPATGSHTWVTGDSAGSSAMVRSSPADSAAAEPGGFAGGRRRPAGGGGSGGGTALPARSGSGSTGTHPAPCTATSGQARMSALRITYSPSGPGASGCR